MNNSFRMPGGVKVTDPRNAGGGKKLRVLLRLGVYLYKYKWIVLLALALTVASNLFALIGPQLSSMPSPAWPSMPSNSDKAPSRSGRCSTTAV